MIKENSRTCIKPLSSQADLQVTEVPPSRSAKATGGRRRPSAANSGALVAGPFNHTARAGEVGTFQALWELFCLPRIC